MDANQRSIWHRQPEYRAQWYCNLITSLRDLTWDLYRGRSHVIHVLQNPHSLNSLIKSDLGIAMKERPEGFGHRNGPKPSFQTPERFNFTQEVLKLRVKYIHVLQKRDFRWDSSCLILGNTDMLPVLDRQRHLLNWNYFNIQLFLTNTWKYPVGGKLDYTATDWDVIQEFTRNGVYHTRLDQQLGGFRLLTEQIVTHECPMSGILTQGHPLRDATNEVTLYNSLFKAFDTETILSGAAITYLPVLLLVALLVQKQSSVANMMKEVFFHCLNALAMFLGHTDYHWNEFFTPLMCRARWTVSIAAVASVAILTLFISFLYCEVFSIDLLTDLLYQPIDWMETFDGIISRQAAYGLKFISFGLSFLTLNQQDIFLLSADHQSGPPNVWLKFIADNEITVRNERDLMVHLGRPETVLQTGHLDCDSLMRWDPLWHRKNYRCLHDLSSTQRRVIIIDPLMDAKRRKSVKRLYRTYVESNLARRQDQLLLQTHQMRTMAAHIFEPHEVTDQLASLGLMSVSTILVNYACLLGGTIGVQLVVLTEERWQLSTGIVDWLANYWHMMVTS